jgi:hypothetical protein
MLGIKKHDGSIPASETRIAVLTTELNKIRAALITEIDNLYTAITSEIQGDAQTAANWALNEENPLPEFNPTYRIERSELIIRGLREKYRQVLLEIAGEQALIKRFESAGRRKVADDLDQKANKFLEQATEIQNVRYIPDRELHETAAPWLGTTRTWKLTASEELRAEAEQYERQAREIEAEPVKDYGHIRLDLDADAAHDPDASPLLTQISAPLYEADPVLAVLQSLVRQPAEDLPPEPRPIIDWALTATSRVLSDRARRFHPHPPPGVYHFEINWHDGQLDTATSNAQFIPG